MDTSLSLSMTRLLLVAKGLKAQSVALSVKTAIVCRFLVHRQRAVSQNLAQSESMEACHHLTSRLMTTRLICACKSYQHRNLSCRIALRRKFRHLKVLKVQL